MFDLDSLWFTWGVLVLNATYLVGRRRSIDPRVRLRLMRASIVSAIGFGRSPLFAMWCGIQMLHFGQVRRYRVPRAGWIVNATIDCAEDGGRVTCGVNETIDTGRRRRGDLRAAGVLRKSKTFGLETCPGGPNIATQSGRPGVAAAGAGRPSEASQDRSGENRP